MPKYAFLNGDVCSSEASYSDALNPLPENAVQIADDEYRVGQKWDGEKWQAVAQQQSQQPAVVITAISVDADHEADTHVAADLRSVDVPVGATLTFTVELRAGAAVLPVSKRFRMPLRSADAVAASRLIAVDFVDGRATFNVALTASRHWRVDEAAINSGLGEGEQLRFAGLDVFALEFS